MRASEPEEAICFAEKPPREPVPKIRNPVAHHITTPHLTSHFTSHFASHHTRNGSSGVALVRIAYLSAVSQVFFLYVPQGSC